MRNDKHTEIMPADVMEQVQQHLKQALALFEPYAIPLTPSERQKLPKMGEKSLSFVEKAHDYCAGNPNLCPPYLDIDQFDADFNGAKQLWTAFGITGQLETLFNDTIMAAGSEAYQQALIFYNSVKIAASQDIPGAKAIYDDLRKRFPQGKRKNGESVTETFTETIKKTESMSEESN
jgi:hypothetical protein